MPKLSTGSEAAGASPTPMMGDTTLISALRTHAFARGLSDSQVEALAALASSVTFEENQVVLESGERSTSFYFVMEGSVAVELRFARALHGVATGRSSPCRGLPDRPAAWRRVAAADSASGSRAGEVHGTALRGDVRGKGVGGSPLGRRGAEKTVHKRVTEGVASALFPRFAQRRERRNALQSF